MEFMFEDDRIYAQDKRGQLLAEVTFPETEDGVMEINHTFVDDSLRGQGIAGDLLQMAVLSIRMQNKKAKPTCSYAIKWFEKHPKEKDLLL